VDGNVKLRLLFQPDENGLPSRARYEPCVVI
jgi:hypothetical protein